MKNSSHSVELKLLQRNRPFHFFFFEFSPTTNTYVICMLHQYTVFLFMLRKTQQNYIICLNIYKQFERKTILKDVTRPFILI